jgi:Uma2 family endonuclease
MTTTRVSRPTSLYTVLPTDQDWPEQGYWTYDDFLRLPDDGNRYEIIAGTLYMVNAPDPEHQFAVTEIVSELRNFVKANQLGVVYAAPIEVHLPDIARPVQPDVLFIAEARRSIVKAKFIEGPPDIIVEVTSPSTMRTDRTVKFDAYERAGVREYWIVNPKTRSIEVYAPINGAYDLHGEFGPGETVTSTVLTGFSLLTDIVFSRA